MEAPVSRPTLKPPQKPPHTDTRKLILRTARDLILSRSYVGLSFQDLADRVGIRKASLYHHFASKEALGLAVITDSLQRFQDWTDGIADQPPAAQLEAYVRMIRELIGLKGRVCPVGATGGVWDCIEPTLQEAVRGFHRAQLDWLAGVARRIKGVDAKAARQWAAQVNALCQGALVSARLQGEIALYDQATAPLVAQLRQLGG